MAISGPEALRSLDEGVRDIRQEEAEISKRLARAGERVAKLRETEAELFRQLAEIRLSTEERAEASGRLIRAEERAHEMIAANTRAVEEAERALTALDKKVAETVRKRRAILDEINTAQEGLRALSEQIAKSVAKDPEYEAKRQEAEQLAAVADESLAKTEVAEADQEQKGRPYRNDPLFMYLWEAGYGTRNYRANNLVRWLDSLVARLVRYHDARPNFAMLNEIPLRLREHAERQAAAAAAAEQEVDALEQAAIDAAGGKPLRDGLMDAQARLDALDETISALEDERDEQARTYRHLVEGRDPAYAEALSILGQSLAGEDMRQLLADARATRTRDDDVVVAKIEETRTRIAEEQSETSDHKHRLKTLAERRRELEDIEWEFKKARFDDPRSVFRDDDLAKDMLGEFLKGAVSAAVYWDRWRKSQSWQAGTSDWGGGIGLPRGGRSRRKDRGFSWPSGGSSGGFSRPRSGSRGSRKSGGFKTGGGF